MPLQARRRPGRPPPPRGHDGQARLAVRAGTGRRERRRRGRVRGDAELHHPARGRAPMTARLALLSDVHGNLAALTAVRAALKKERPDAVVVAGDHALNGPDPAGVVDSLREMESTGATIIQGN